MNMETNYGESHLTYGGWDKMGAISQTTFGSAFSSMNMIVWCPLKMVSYE